MIEYRIPTELRGQRRTWMLQDVSGVVSRGFLGRTRLSLPLPSLPMFVYFSHCFRRPISISSLIASFPPSRLPVASLHTSLAPALRISSFSSFPLCRWPSNSFSPFPGQPYYPFLAKTFIFPLAGQLNWRNPRPSPNPSKSWILSPESIASTLSPHVHYRSSLFSKDHLFITIRLSFIST